MGISEISAIIGAAFSLICTLAVGALVFFIKKTLSDLEAEDKKNAQDIEKIKNDLYDLEKNLPIAFVQRGDFIKATEKLESRIDKISDKLENKIDELIRVLNRRKED